MSPCIVIFVSPVDAGSGRESIALRSVSEVRILSNSNLDITHRTKSIRHWYSGTPLKSTPDNGHSLIEATLLC